MSDEKENAVKIEHIDGEWAVQIVEAGEVTQHRFELQTFALSFAAGQRIRLGLEPVELGSDGRRGPQSGPHGLSKPRNG